MTENPITQWRKRAYLHAMDIPIWIDRTRCKPNSALPVTIPNNVQPQPAIKAEPDWQEQPPLKPLAALHKALPPKTTTPAEPLAKTALQSAPDKLDTAAPQLRLFVMPLADDGLVIGELPVHGGLFNQFHAQLVTDIVLSVNRNLLSQPPLHYTFEWPACSFVESYGHQGAMDGLQGFLDNQFDWPKCRWVLILGAQAARFTLAESEECTPLKGVHQQDKRTLVITHSLTEIMKIPQLKADVWQDIKPCLCQQN